MAKKCISCTCHVLVHHLNLQVWASVSIKLPSYIRETLNLSQLTSWQVQVIFLSKRCFSPHCKWAAEPAWEPETCHILFIFLCVKKMSLLCIPPSTIFFTRIALVLFDEIFRQCRCDLIFEHKYVFLLSVCAFLWTARFFEQNPSFRQKAHLCRLLQSSR